MTTKREVEKRNVEVGELIMKLGAARLAVLRKIDNYAIARRQYEMGDPGDKFNESYLAKTKADMLLAVFPDLLK